MKKAINEFPEMMKQGIALGKSFKFPWKKEQIDSILILGMGGSALGGEMAKAVFETSSSIPVSLIRDEEIPGFVNDKTLVIAVSYSGSTKETLAALDASLLKTNKIIGILSGGKLKEICLKRGFPCLEIPSGLMPRAALPYLFTPLLFMLNEVSPFSALNSSLEEALRILEKMREDLTRTPNSAEETAQKLYGKIPVIYAESPLLAPAAYRWKCQINENAKQPAYVQVFPEAYHNDIVGFTQKLPVHSCMAAVFLRDKPACSEKVDFFAERLQKAGVLPLNQFSEGFSVLTKLLFFAYFGDFVSLYLADKNRVNPEEIQVIDDFKKRFK